MDDQDQILELWPHQQFALNELVPIVGTGQSVCVTSPTGGGKSTIMAELLRLGVPAVLYTHRRMLLDQTAKVLASNGIHFGVRAAGHEEDFEAPIQLASVQTDDSRVVKRGRRDLHDAALVVVDEAHMIKGAQACELLRRYRERGATIIGFTATPLDISHIYDRLIVAGTNSELRDCGALVMADHFGPDEPDLRHIKRQRSGEFKSGDITKAILTHVIFGRVIEHYRLYNPEQKPALLFAPGVKESIWFAEQLTRHGIPSAHIDGDNVWIEGKFFKSDQAARNAVMTLSREGVIKIITNRHVLREGINAPWLEHGIFATAMGSLTSWVQSGGRLLRANPAGGKERCVIQDHGGMTHRLGVLNEDRTWDIGLTDYIVSEHREAMMRKKVEPEPILCPKCHCYRLSGSKCHNCGFEHTASGRVVIQANGQLKEVSGDIYKPARKDNRPGVEKRWERMYYRFRKTDKTFNQARGCYKYENFWCDIPDGIPFTPVDPLDWFRPVKEIPMSRLVLPVKDHNESPTTR
jgi:superfamily II DNA or RNA helicase